MELLRAARGVTHGRAFAFGRLDGILACVAAGMGFALLPPAVVTAQPTRFAVHYCAIDADIGEVTTWLATPHPDGWSPALAASVDTLSADSFQDHLPQPVTR